jgi:hypothetical protein
MPEALISLMALLMALTVPSLESRRQYSDRHPDNACPVSGRDPPHRRQPGSLSSALCQRSSQRTHPEHTLRHPCGAERSAVQAPSHLQPRAPSLGIPQNDIRSSKYHLYIAQLLEGPSKKEQDFPIYVHPNYGRASAFAVQGSVAPCVTASRAGLLSLQATACPSVCGCTGPTTASAGYTQTALALAEQCLLACWCLMVSCLNDHD